VANGGSFGSITVSDTSTLAVDYLRLTGGMTVYSNTVTITSVTTSSLGIYFVNNSNVSIVTGGANWQVPLVLTSLYPVTLAENSPVTGLTQIQSIATSSTNSSAYLKFQSANTFTVGAFYFGTGSSIKAITSTVASNPTNIKFPALHYGTQGSSSELVDTVLTDLSVTPNYLLYAYTNTNYTALMNEFSSITYTNVSTAGLTLDANAFTSSSAKYPKDDEWVAVPMPAWLVFSYNGVEYSTVYVASNSYLTFGGGSTSVSPTRSDPYFPKILITSGDGNLQQLYTGVEGTSPNRTFRVLFRGNSVYTSNTTINMEWSATFYENNKKQIDIQIGQNAGASISGRIAGFYSADALLHEIVASTARYVGYQFSSGNLLVTTGTSGISFNKKPVTSSLFLV